MMNEDMILGHGESYPQMSAPTTLGAKLTELKAQNIRLRTQLKEARDIIKGLLGEDRDFHYSQEWYAKVEAFLKETE